MLESLKQFLLIIKAREDVQEYISIVKEGFTLAKICYYTLAGNYFNDGNYLMADHYIQRANALKLPYASKSTELAELLDQFSDEQKYKEARQDCLEKRLRHFIDGSKEGLAKEHDNWLIDTNKVQLANYTAKVLNSFDKPVCLELGSHAGALLHLIEARCLVTPTLLGIEPQPEAVNFCKEKYPHLNIKQGNHNDLKEFNGYPVSVLLLSCVLLLMEPEEVETVFEFAQTNCRYMVIMDDVVNFNGDKAIPRRYYLLHPYKRLFDRHGFTIIEKHFPPTPNWAISGVLIVKNDNG